MPYRLTPLAEGEVYHIYNQGVARSAVFTQTTDYSRLIETFAYYQYRDPPVRFSQIARWLAKQKVSPVKPSAPRIVEIYCYCLMPNHFHLLIKQLSEDGVSTFVSRSINSYTRYFNTRHRRVGPLFKGPFKAVRIETDQQLIHVSRYIHLNPLVSFVTRDLNKYRWSSYPTYIGLVKDNLCKKEEVLSHFSSVEDYQSFVLSRADYAKELEEIKHLLLEERQKY